MGRHRPRNPSNLHSLAINRAIKPDTEAIARELWVGRSPAELTEVGGLLAGGWMAQPITTDPAHLISAGLLLTGEIDRDQLVRWLREGWSRAHSFHSGSGF